MIDGVFVFDEAMRLRYIHWRKDGDRLIAFELRREISKRSHEKSISIFPFVGKMAMFQRRARVIAAVIGSCENDYLALSEWIDGLQVLLNVSNLLPFDLINGHPLVFIYTMHSVYAPSQERGVVSVKGEDCAKFLHGLTTSNVNKLWQSDHPSAQFSAFLDHSGRVLFDVFLWRGVTENMERQVLIDCQRPYVKDIMYHMHAYKVRARVSISDHTEQWTALAVDESREEFQQRIDKKNITNAVRDTRSLKWQLSRYLLRRGEEKVVFKDTDETSRQDYRIKRMQYGVPEGFVEIKSAIAIPFDYNLDLMGAIDFEKGCYLGQELITRVRHQGQIRKRCHPIRLFHPEQFNRAFFFNPDFSKDHKVIPDTDLMGAQVDSRDVGKIGYSCQYEVKMGRIVRSVGNVGIAMIREEHLQSTNWAALCTQEPSVVLCEIL